MSNKVNIKYDSKEHLFHLSNSKISYIIELVEDKYLIHRYWGRKLNHYNFSNKPVPQKRTFAAVPDDNKPEFSLDIEPQEFSTPHKGDYRESTLEIKLPNGYSVSNFVYKKYEILDTVPELSELPHIRNAENKPSKTLVIYLADNISNVKLLLNYSILENSSCIIRSSKIINCGEKSVYIDKALSASVDMSFDNQDFISFYGSHQKEFQINRQKVSHGKFSTGSTRCASSPQYPPFLALCSPNATEHNGEVHAMNLIYSGNHFEQIELDQYYHIRFSMGIHPDSFEWQLNPGENFQTPQVVLTYSRDGFNGMSQEFHNLYTESLINPNWKNRKRPLLINSWEMCYFNISEEKMTDMITNAAALGFELVVLDDGWFGKRNNSRTSLGDWTVNTEKFPNGLQPLIDHAHKNNISFGIWFEPEMISPNSQLIKEHPDWVVHVPDYEQMLGRHQLVLDLTQKEVQDYIINIFANYLEKYSISYIKWDMNRHITEPGSPLLSSQQTGEFSHRYILGLYRILNVLTAKYPDILFENCSSGGGRFDPGMTYFMPQTWCSDNTDALDRERIQYGASYLYPPSAITAHVSDVPNHQTNRIIPFSTRASVASSANMGYEMNILNLSETEKTDIKQHLKWYKENRELILSSEFYRLISPFDNNSNHCCWMIVNKEKTSALIYFFTKSFDVCELSYLLKIPYLNPEYIYYDQSSDKYYSGEELAYAGLSIEQKPGDYSAVQISLKALNKNSK